MRLSGGAGVGPSVEKSGAAMMFDVMIGGTREPGLVLGGALVSHGMYDVHNKWGGLDLLTPHLATLGLFAAAYPYPRRGFNFHLLVGYCNASKRFGDFAYQYNVRAAAFMAGAGYDFWVADQWSIGPDFRLAVFDVEYKGADASHEGWMPVPTLSLTVTYH